MSVRLTLDERGVATLLIDRATRRNALDSATVQALTHAARGLQSAPSLRAVVLRSAGDAAFSAGADVTELTSLTADSARPFITRIHDACAALRDIPVPVIARIQGHTLGAGLEIAAACDIRIASGTARFGMPEVRLGIPSVVEAALLPSLIGWGRTRWLLLTGQTIDAAITRGIDRFAQAWETDEPPRMIAAFRKRQPPRTST